MPQPDAHATVSAPAKLNLHLKILAREDTGYHGIETVFHKLTLADDVHLALRPPGDTEITCTVDVGPPEQNLAFRAAQAFCRTTGWDTGFSIHITKRIPHGGGLGGGSADAAATLRGFNKLAPRPLSSVELLKLAAPLGADVPFLTSKAVMALAWNRGERMLPLAPLPERHVILVIPDFGINTAEAYRLIDDASPTQPVSPVALPQSTLAHWESLAAWSTNDFTTVVSRMHPAIAHNIDVLRKAGAIQANLTGSGSVVFGIFETFPDTNQIARATQCRVVATHTAQH